MKKIMFNDKYGLTKAVLEGRKTQTRRAIKLQDGEYVKVVALDNSSFMSYVAKDGKPTAHVGALDMPNFVRVLAPKYFIGEEVAIAQSYHDAKKEVGGLKNLIEGHPLPSAKGINNKMFVKADLMPHRIKITNIRVERLQDISDEDCLKEGIIRNKFISWVHYYHPHGREYGTPLQAFADLIDKTCGKGTWDSNPWVFVYDFVLLK